MKIFKTLILLPLLAILAGCAATTLPPRNYANFQRLTPRSILVVPVINHSNETQAADLFLATLAVPLAERGFYVLPTNLSKKLIEQDGLSDPGLVHSSSTQTMASLFGADSVLYVEILDWKSKYVITASNIEVKFLYTLKSGRDGSLLWQQQQAAVYSSSSNSGNIFADLIATAVKSMLDNARADYTPVAAQANALALLPEGQGLPYGPYSPNYARNATVFPADGKGKISNATIAAVSYPVEPSAK